MNQLITKAIIPVAGFGTRFLPATKAQPKEMLTLVDKPVIQYIIEEAVDSGITEIILVTGQNKRAIEDHFDRNFELEYRLKQKKKTQELKEIDRISNMAKFYYVRQQTPLGDGHAVLQAIDLVGKDEPVAILFGDDIVVGGDPALKQLMRIFNKHNSSVIAAEKIDKKYTNKYGIIDIAGKKDKTSKVVGLVEKPNSKDAPSDIAVIGKYIVTPHVLQELKKVKPDKSGEIRLIDALKAVLNKETVYAHQYQGTRYDCGSKLGFLKATVHFGLKHKELKKDFAKYLKTIKL